MTIARPAVARRQLIDVPGTARAAGRALVTLAAVLLVWYGACALVRLTGDTSAIAKMPWPHEVFQQMATYWPTYLEAAWQTGSRAVAGFFVGLLVGLLLGLLMIQSRWLESGLVPYVLASQMIPLIALVPILRAVFKDGDLVRLYVTAYVSFFIVTIAVLRGLKSASPTSLELMSSVNADRWTTARYLRLPAALPFIFAGLRVAAPLSLIGAILVDFLGARNGIGYLLVASLSLGSSQATMLWGALILAMGMGLAFTRAVVYVERRMCFWAPAFRSQPQ